MSLRSKSSAVFGAAAAIVALTAAAAFACTNLATLSLSNATGKPGDIVKVTGTSFAVSTEKSPVNPVVLRWGGADGPVLAENLTPDKAGNISTDVTIPQATPGSHMIMAFQTKATPTPGEAAMSGHNPKADNVFGTPARVTFQVVGPTGEPVAQQVPGPNQVTVSGEPSSVGIVALTVGLGALGLALFGAGFVAFVRQVRRREVPASAPVYRD